MVTKILGIHLSGDTCPKYEFSRNEIRQNSDKNCGDCLNGLMWVAKVRHAVAVHAVLQRKQQRVHECEAKYCLQQTRFVIERKRSVTPKAKYKGNRVQNAHRDNRAHDKCHQNIG